MSGGFSTPRLLRSPSRSLKLLTPCLLTPLSISYLRVSALNGDQVVKLQNDIYKCRNTSKREQGIETYRKKQNLRFLRNVAVSGYGKCHKVRRYS